MRKLIIILLPTILIISSCSIFRKYLIFYKSSDKSKYYVTLERIANQKYIDIKKYKNDKLQTYYFYRFDGWLEQNNTVLKLEKIGKSKYISWEGVTDTFPIIKCHEYIIFNKRLSNEMQFIKISLEEKSIINLSICELSHYNNNLINNNVDKIIGFVRSSRDK